MDVKLGLLYYGKNIDWRYSS